MRCLVGEGTRDPRRHFAFCLFFFFPWWLLAAMLRTVVTVPSWYNGRRRPLLSRVPNLGELAFLFSETSIALGQADGGARAVSRCFRDCLLRWRRRGSLLSSPSGKTACRISIHWMTRLSTPVIKAVKVASPARCCRDLLQDPLLGKPLKLPCVPKRDGPYELPHPLLQRGTGPERAAQVVDRFGIPDNLWTK